MKAKEIHSLLNRAASALSGASTADEQQRTLADINRALSEESGNPWWVIALKILAYAIGLILAGYGTTAAAATLMAII
jgi:hypothetical protein